MKVLSAVDSIPLALGEIKATDAVLHVCNQTLLCLSWQSLQHDQTFPLA